MNTIRTLAIVLVILAAAVRTGAEEITLTTYYPSPRGVYDQLRTMHDTYLAIQGGSVGIGMLNPGSKLSVSGGVSIGADYATIAAPADGMIIQGNVGIGTTNPWATASSTAPLWVHGGPTQANGDPQIDVDSNGQQSMVIAFSTDGGNPAGVIGVEGYAAGTIFPGSFAGGMVIGQRFANAPLQFFTSGTPRMSISSSGNVGIGTPGATAPFEVDMNAQPARVVALVRNTTGSGGSSYGLEIDAGNGNSSDMPLRVFDRTGTSNYLTVLGNGSVGIGTVTPAAGFALDVIGKIRSSVLTQPTDLDETVTTKSYVDTAAGGVQYLGRTVSSYTGNLGGIAGANVRCQARFSGSHMCRMSELVSSGATGFGGNGWVTEVITIFSGAFYCASVDGATMFWAGGDGTCGCSSWTSTSPNGRGQAADASGSAVFASCDGALPIHCCK